ncbi:MAG TPA: S8 family peptidase [Blastocatellia bacterium]|jgi:subtilisin family serine protease|nr:S8 family peptidase [Blastocatellia bacterium]
MRSRKILFNFLPIPLLLSSLIAGIIPDRVFNAGVYAAGAVSKKISDDLQGTISKDPDKKLKVIIQTNAAPSRGLASSVGYSGGNVKKAYRNFDAIAIEIPAKAVESLASRKDIKFASLDAPTRVAGHLETTTGTDQARGYWNSSNGGDSFGPLDGSGIGIAILDSGVDPDHHAFHSSGAGSRIIQSIDFTGEGRTDDPYGHGTHVASTAAGGGHVASGAYTGMAPGANIINVRVLSSEGQGAISDALAGIDWCITNKDLYNIRVLNMSFGAITFDSYVNDPLCQAVRRAFDAGLVVCAAAGNLGKDENGTKLYGAIHSPGIEPSAITVGAANTFGTDERSDDAIASFSSRGPTRGYTTDADGTKHYDNLIKPDLVAPGNKLIEAKSPGNYLVTNHPNLDAQVSGYAPHSMMYMSGTSMATPVVAGAAALMLQRNPSLTPNLIKAMLEFTAQPVNGFNNFEQGAGQLNAEGAIRLAGLVRQDLASLPVGDPLLNGPPPLQETTIAGETFPWGMGVIQRWNFISGSDLFLFYQGIYGRAILMSEGVTLSEGVLVSNGSLLSSGVLLSEGVLISDGTVLSNGVLLSEGTILSSGTMADGSLLSSGVLISDGAFASSTSSSASAALAQAALGGDNTASMSLTIDYSGGEK